MKQGRLKPSKIITMPNTQKFRDNFDEIFMKDLKAPKTAMEDPKTRVRNKEGKL